MNWTEITIKVPQKDTDLAAAIANMTVPYGIYIEDYSDLEQKAEEYRQRFGASVFFLTAPPVPMSSSEVRDRIQKGREWESAVPAEVARIIREKGLYQ